MQTDFTQAAIDQELGYDAFPTVETEWPDPEPLPEGLPPVAELDSAIIPEQVRGWIEDVSDRMQIPPDFSAATITVAIGVLHVAENVR